ncbi:MAG: hypothetical protein Q7T86_11785 [Hyphomicrobiaceae bacterium]|nr:hypothetical protein [Hyphomicrobiaceae bacterium]
MGAWTRGQIQAALAGMDFQELVHILAYKYFIAKIELEPGEINDANSDVAEDRTVFQLELRDIIKRFKIRDLEEFDRVIESTSGIYYAHWLLKATYGFGRRADVVKMRKATDYVEKAIKILEEPGIKKRLGDALALTEKSLQQQLASAATALEQASFNGAVKKEFRSMDLAGAGANLLRYYRMTFGQNCKFYHTGKMSDHGGSPAFSFVLQCLQLIDPSLTVSNLKRLAKDIEHLVPQIIDLRSD